MTGLVTGRDLCAGWPAVVKVGWRGPWPCVGSIVMRSAGTPVGLVECTCGCHRGEFTHELPARANRTAVHPSDVLADG